MSKFYIHKITLEHIKRYLTFGYEIEEEYIINNYNGIELHSEIEEIRYKDKDILKYYVYVISPDPKLEYNISLYKEDNESKTEETFTNVSNYEYIIYY